MKRILSTVIALSAMAAATQAHATDFILSSNTANPLWINFRLTAATPTGVSASLSNNIGINSFTDNYFFAPSIPASVGSGAATTNLTSALNFSVPNGLTITGYALTGAVQAALIDAFTSANYAGDLAVINGYLATLPPAVYFQAGTGDNLQQQLQSVPLSAANFYKITISGQGTSDLSRYDGNLSATSVPEPATWAMMLAGFGAIGFAMRRQRKPQPKVRFAF